MKRIYILLVFLIGCAVTQPSPYQSQYNQIWELYTEGKITPDEYDQLKQEIFLKEQEYYYQMQNYENQRRQELGNIFSKNIRSYTESTKEIYNNKPIYTDCTTSGNQTHCKSKQSAW